MRGQATPFLWELYTLVGSSSVFYDTGHILTQQLTCAIGESVNMTKPNTNGRGPGRPVKNVVPKIQASAEQIFKAMFRASRKKRDVRIKTEITQRPTSK